MGFIKYANDVTAPVSVAFAYAENPRAIPQWMPWATHCERIGTTERGAGAKYDVRFRVGLWHPVLRWTITEHRQDAVLTYALSGPVTAGLTLRFDPLGRGRSVLVTEIDYRLPTGFAATLRDRPRRALLRTTLQRVQDQLRREIEEFHGRDVVGRYA